MEDMTKLNKDTLKSLRDVYGELTTYAASCCKKLFVGINCPTTCGTCQQPVRVVTLTPESDLEEAVAFLYDNPATP